MISCPICQDAEFQIYFENTKHRFLQCDRCNTVYRHPSNYMSREAEKIRYETHHNDVENKGYQEFVTPVIQAVTNHFTKEAQGLDYGAGTGPVASKLLGDLGYTMHLYDPFFHPDTQVLKRTYDFIICCEVIEHFHRPIHEFKRLITLLKPGGKLYCMTDFLPKQPQQFSSWYYKNDLTHVVFYSEENIHFIRNKIGFKEVVIRERLIIFTAPPY